MRVLLREIIEAAALFSLEGSFRDDETACAISCLRLLVAPREARIGGEARAGLEGGRPLVGHGADEGDAAGKIVVGFGDVGGGAAVARSEDAKRRVRCGRVHERRGEKRSAVAKLRTPGGGFVAAGSDPADLLPEERPRRRSWGRSGRWTLRCQLQEDRGGELGSRFRGRRGRVAAVGPRHGLPSSEELRFPAGAFGRCWFCERPEKAGFEDVNKKRLLCVFDSCHREGLPSPLIWCCCHGYCWWSYSTAPPVAGVLLQGRWFAVARVLVCGCNGAGSRLILGVL
ncbi:hypothetical protein MLD38_033630 [Melastoma candidum]|uniref:Uncharacterized protein n=1 Tax=Melastoma candidum TaxID=119954 RepID=A0ACB9M9P1_9MYRT|nr:hypothetical protein MLD38_033630 [Melastoma candidum]